MGKQTARVVEGIVGSAGGGSSGGGNWDLVLFLSPWRESGGPLLKRELRLVIPIGKDAALKRAMARCRAGTAISVSVSMLEKKKGANWWSAFGSAPIRDADKAQFQKAVKRRAEPRVVQDETLGELKLDRGMGWYEGTRRIRRTSYSVAVLTPHPDDQKKVTRAITAAGPRVVAVENEWGALLDQIATALLDRYNEKWRQGGKALSPTAFKKQLEPSELHVDEQAITLYLTSGKLFADHGVEVRIPRRGKQREIRIS